MPSLTDLLLHKDVWSLTSLDTDLKIEGQFVPTDLSEDLSANYASQGTLGREVPLRQYQNGSGSNFRFTAKCWAHSQGLPAGPVGTGINAESIEGLVDAIKSTVKINKDLGRPDIFTFQVGKAVELASCVVLSVGRIRYDRLRPLDGSLRGVTFSIELAEFVEYDLSITGSGAESLVLPIRDGESFEHLGRRVYNDPKTGEALRRRNPDKAVPGVGDLIHLPPKVSLMRGFKRTPQAVPLGRGVQRKEDNRLAYLKARDRDFRMFSVRWGSDYRRHP